MGAKAKLIRKPKRRIRYEAIAFLFFAVMGIFYACSMTGLKRKNYETSLKVQELQMQIADKKEEITYLQSQVYALSARERIVSMVAKYGIKTNQDQVVILTETE